MPDRLTAADEARLEQVADAWLSTVDPTANAAIIDLLRQVATAGHDPATELRKAMACWFGPSAAAALPLRTPGQPVSISSGFAIEPLSPVRPPTMWPQRPKRLPDELFSSWLRRAALAGGVAPRQFTRDVLGKLDGDVDQTMTPAMPRLLAERSGQTVRHVAGGLLVRPEVRSDTIAGHVEDLLLRDRRFLLTRADRGRRGGSLPALQYCPCCLREDSRPHFRRVWRFIHVASCEDHDCCLHDQCWRCGSSISALDQRTLDRQPSCATCDAALMNAPLIRSPGTSSRQKTLTMMLLHVATQVATSEQGVHLDTLADWLGTTARTGVQGRERALRQLRPSTWKLWFGPPVRSSVKP